MPLRVMRLWRMIPVSTMEKAGSVTVEGRSFGMYYMKQLYHWSEKMQNFGQSTSTIVRGKKIR